MRYEASYMLILIYASYCTAKHSYIEYEVSTSALTAALPVTAISNGRTSSYEPHIASYSYLPHMSLIRRRELPHMDTLTLHVTYRYYESRTVRRAKRVRTYDRPDVLARACVGFTAVRGQKEWSGHSAGGSALTKWHSGLLQDSQIPNIVIHM